MDRIPISCRCEGLRHARNLMYKQWFKERRRAIDLSTRNEILVGEIKDLKVRLKFITERYT